MLDIEYKGATCVVLSTKNSKLIMDPKLSTVSLTDVNTKDVIELATEQRYATGSANVFIAIEGPGEYEVGDFSIKGIAAQRYIDHDESKQATIYRIEVGDFRIGVLGHVAAKLSEEQLEQIGVVDILLIPVGGNGFTLDAVSALTIIKQIEPKIVVPLHYADKAITYEVPQDSFDIFVKEFGGTVEQDGPKYKLKNSNALGDSVSVIQIDRSK